jgi:hypothetical protein
VRHFGSNKEIVSHTQRSTAPQQRCCCCAIFEYLYATRNLASEERRRTQHENIKVQKHGSTTTLEHENIRARKLQSTETLQHENIYILCPVGFMLDLLIVRGFESPTGLPSLDICAHVVMSQLERSPERQAKGSVDIHHESNTCSTSHEEEFGR